MHRFPRWFIHVTDCRAAGWELYHRNFFHPALTRWFPEHKELSFANYWVVDARGACYAVSRPCAWPRRARGRRRFFNHSWNAARTAPQALAENLGWIILRASQLFLWEKCRLEMSDDAFYGRFVGWKLYMRIWRRFSVQSEKHSKGNKECKSIHL